MRVKVEFETEATLHQGKQYEIDWPVQNGLYRSASSTANCHRFWIDAEFVTEIVEPFGDGDIVHNNGSGVGRRASNDKWYFAGGSNTTDDEVSKMLDYRGWTLIKNPSAH